MTRIRTALAMAMAVGVVTALAVPGAALARPAAGPAGVTETALPVVSSDASHYPQVQIVVSSPPGVSGQTLPASSFSVTENGHLRQAHVEAAPAHDVQIAVVIDTSGSMAGAPLAAAKVAASAFLSSLPVAAPATVVGFGAAPVVVSPLSTDRAAQLASIDGLVAGGETALYDAVQSAVGQLASPSSGGTQRFVVLLSDGADTTSAATLEATTAALAAGGVAVFVVDLHTGASDAPALARLVSATGGQLVEAGDPNALTGAFEKVAASIARQYTVSYTSTEHAAVDVRVMVNVNGVTAVANQRLRLPSSASAVAVDGGGSAWSSHTWVLVAGAALVATAALIVLLMLVAFRVPRARGLQKQGWVGLAGVAEHASRLGDSALQRGGGTATVSGALERAGLELRPGEFVVIVASAAIGALALGWLVISALVGLVAAAVIVVASRIVIGQLAARRRRRFEAQLAGALQLLAGALRAGHGLAHAIETVASESESPASDEFRRLTIETRLGRDFGDALWAVAGRVRSTDFEWVAQAIDIQREVGGDLAQILDAVASTIRDRERLRRQISVLSAEGRISAWVLMVLPFGLGAVMASTNPEYIGRLFESSRGYMMLAAGGVLLAAGGVWLRRIVRPIF
jgi:tight adherence protein B